MSELRGVTGQFNVLVAKPQMEAQVLSPSQLAAEAGVLGMKANKPAPWTMK